jgi:uncharacterized protein YcbX
MKVPIDHRIVRQLFCHPVKGLTPAVVECAEFVTDWGMQGDRALALMFDDLDPQPAPNLPWLSKGYFAVQNDWPDLARLHCAYDADLKRLSVELEGQPVLDAEVDRDREAIGAWFSAFLQTCEPSPGARHPQPAAIALVGETSGATGFRDRRTGQVSIIGSATLDALSASLKTPIDPRRFRPNLVLDTAQPWEEFDWIGQRLQIGAVELTAIEPIERCLNIEVCPDSGRRDLPLLSTLKREFRHLDVGIIAHVTHGGTIAIGESYAILRG